MSWLGKLLGRPDDHVAEARESSNGTRRSTTKLIRAVRRDVKQSHSTEEAMRDSLAASKAVNDEMDQMLDDTLRAVSDKRDRR